MNWRERFLVVVQILCLGHSLAQSPQPGGSVQCQPCRNSDQYVQCPGDQCPRSLQVDESPAPGTCQLPVPEAATTSTAATAAAAADADAATTGGNSSSSVVDGGKNSTSEPETTSTTTTTAIIPTDSNVTTAMNPVTSPASTSTPERLILCRVCVTNCLRCQGDGPDDCLECRKGHELRTSSNNGTRQCLPKENDDDDDSGVSIAIIAGASAGGGVVLVLVLVLTCVCCRRCAARRKDQEQGLGMVMMDDIVPRQPAEKQQDPADKTEEEDVQRRPTRPVMEIPEYVNVKSTMPRPISIERGHDKVTRYVRDPTFKKPEPPLPVTEEQELAQLPAAPIPPPGARKRSIDVGGGGGGSGDATHHPSHPNHPPFRAHTTPPTTTTLPDSSTLPDRRRRAGATSTLPAAAHFRSEPHLPKFPIEEEMEKQEREASGGRAAPLPNPAPLKDEEEDSEVDVEDPEMDYENMGPKAKLEPAGAGGPQRSGGQHGGGVINPGLDVEDEEEEEEEPEDDYVNQAALRQEALTEDVDENPYQNWPQPRGVR